MHTSIVAALDLKNIFHLNITRFSQKKKIPSVTSPDIIGRAELGRIIQSFAIDNLNVRRTTGFVKSGRSSEA